MDDDWRRARRILDLVQPARASAAIAVEVWQRLGIAVRCGDCPSCPCVARRYLDAAQRIVSTGALPALHVHRRTLEVLLQAARDEVLPWTWRCACLEHAIGPLEHLRSVLRLHDPLACESLHAAMQAVGDRLAQTMPGRGIP